MVHVHNPANVCCSPHRDDLLQKRACQTPRLCKKLVSGANAKSFKFPETLFLDADTLPNPRRKVKIFTKTVEFEEPPAQGFC